VSTTQPLVSAVLVTRDRPAFLSVALRAFTEQTWANRELVVVDDGDRSPADEAAIHAVGGRLVRLPTGTTLGEKLNAGAAEARGLIVQKWDDDDFYSSRYMETMSRRILDAWGTSCFPAIAFLQPFLFFSIPQWQFRRSSNRDAAGGSLTFPRSTWEEFPFKQIFSQEDFWFMMTGLHKGVKWLPVRSEGAFVNIRHSPALGHQPHLWTRQWDNRSMDDHVSQLETADIDPTTIFPEWALATYRDMHERVRAAQPV
jgi:glycosyltransferase involved in cell wall biosynthesis